MPGNAPWPLAGRPSPRPFSPPSTLPGRLAMEPRAPALLDRLDLLEWRLCQRIGRFNLYRPWLALLRLASRLGDWPAWVALLLAQPLLQESGGWQRLLQYGLTALAAIAVYRLMKTRLCRERPFITFVGNVRSHEPAREDRKSTRLNSSHVRISYAVFCLKKKKKNNPINNNKKTTKDSIHHTQ